jgi:hypothetical protein
MNNANTNPARLTNDALDAALTADPDNAALWTERSRRIAAQLQANADAEAVYMETGEWPQGSDLVDNGLGLVKVTKLGDAAVHFIGDAQGLLEGDLAADFYTEGRTVVETTRRVLEAILDRVDVDSYVEDAEAAAWNATTDEEVAFVARSARRSILTTVAKVKAALAGRRPSRVRF